MYLYVMNNNILKVLMTYDRILENKKFVLVETDIGGIDELIYNPATKEGGVIGYGYKHGKKRPMNVKGHDTHLHIGFTNRQVAMDVIDKAHSMGLVTTENPYAKRDPTGKIERVHVDTSFHYKTFPGSPLVGAGVDISGNRETIIELIKWINLKYANQFLAKDTTTNQNTNSTEDKSNVVDVDEPQKVEYTPTIVDELPPNEIIRTAALGIGKSLGLKEIRKDIERIKKLLK
jgi:hypothetical protein